MLFILQSFISWNITCMKTISFWKVKCSVFFNVLYTILYDLWWYDVNSVNHLAHFYAYWWGFPLRSLNIYGIEIELQSFPVSTLDIVSENDISTFNLLNFDSYKIVSFRLAFWVSSFNVQTTSCALKNYLKWGLFQEVINCLW